MLYDIFNEPAPQQVDEPTRSSSRKRKLTEQLGVDPSGKRYKVK